MIIDTIMTDKISLNGLGFVQVQLEGDQCLQVWHPELPRRACFEHSAIYNHHFDSVSRVLIGTQIMHCYGIRHREDGDFILYVREGLCDSNGRQQWIPQTRVHLDHRATFGLPAGREDHALAYEYHRTEPGGDGRVAKIVRMTCEYLDGAHATCRVGVEPDTKFDHKQWSSAQLWEVVSDVLLGTGRAES